MVDSMASDCTPNGIVRKANTLVGIWLEEAFVRFYRICFLVPRGVESDDVRASDEPFPDVGDELVVDSGGTWRWSGREKEIQAIGWR